MLKKFIFLIGFILLTGCVSNSISSAVGDDSFIFSTKAQITDKTQDTTNNVSIDIFLKKNTAFRLEVTALLGYQVGSLLMTRSSLQYAVHPQKIFVHGPMAGRTLKPLFKQEIEPQILWSLINDDDLNLRGFKCIKPQASMQICKSSQADLEIEQRGDLDNHGISKEGLKKITLENKNLKMIWIFKSKQLLSSSQNETFVLNRPKEYKLIAIK